MQALSREIQEETGWRLSHVGPLLQVLEWEADRLGRLELDFLVEVEGDLEQPVLEKTKVSAYRWLGLAEIDVLKENRMVDDLAIFRFVQHALATSV